MCSPHPFFDPTSVVQTVVQDTVLDWLGQVGGVGRVTNSERWRRDVLVRDWPRSYLGMGWGLVPQSSLMVSSVLKPVGQALLRVLAQSHLGASGLPGERTRLPGI